MKPTKSVIAILDEHIDNVECKINEMSEKILCNPEVSTYYVERGLCFYQVGRIEEAITDFSKAIELVPNEAKLYYFRAMCYKEQEKKSVTVNDKKYKMYHFDFAKVIELINGEKNYLKYGNEDSTAEFSIEDIIGIFVEIDAKIALFTDYEKAEHKLRDKEYDKAIVYINKAINENPNEDELFFLKWRCLARKGDLNQGIEVINKAIELNPNCTKYYIIRAGYYYKVNLISASFADYSKIIEIDPANAFFYFMRAGRLYKENYYDEAFSDYSKANELDPKNLLFVNVYADRYIKRRQYPQAIEVYTQAIKKEENSEFYYNRAYLYLLISKTEEAKKDFSRVIEMFPDESFPYYNRSLIFKCIGDNESALSDLSKAIEIKPDNNEYLNKRVEYFEKMGRFQEALNDLDKIIENGRDKKARIKKISIYYKLNQYEKLLDEVRLLDKPINADAGFEEDNWEITIEEFDSEQYLQLADILTECSLSLMIKILRVLYSFEKYERFNLNDLEKFADTFDEIVNNKIDILDEHITLYRNVVYKFPKADLSFIKNSKNCQLTLLRIKQYIFKKIKLKMNAYNLLTLYCGKLPKENYIEIMSISLFFDKLSERLQEKYDSIVEDNERERERERAKHEEEKIRAVAKAKDELMQSFSHKMKNSFPKSIANLENLEAELPQAKDEIDTAIKQIRHLEKLAHSINFSFKGSIEDIQFDIQNPVNGRSFKSMILGALDNSIENLLDKSGVYSVYTSRYLDLPTKKNARAEYSKLSLKDYGNLQEFLSKYFLELKIEFGNSENYIIGNSRHSQVKFAEIIEELVFNALKYAASAEKRYLNINFTTDQDMIVLVIENSCIAANNQLKTSGLGRQIVKNTLEALKIDYEHITDEASYKAVVKIPDWWKTIHNEVENG